MAPDLRRPRIAVSWIEFALALTGAAFGVAMLAATVQLTTTDAIKVAGIPVATAIAAGLLFRTAEDRRLPAGLWIALVFPVVHVALISAVAAMAGAHLTGIERSDELHPALLWLDLRAVGGLFGVDAVVLAILTVITLVAAKGKKVRVDG